MKSDLKFIFSNLCNYLRTTVILIMISVLLLSVASAKKTEEPRRCYWCGPLAEQVHRSRRAPLCSADGENVTICEPEYRYCAIVATSPPYVESRYCVKMYQDECYSLYCNTTNTWKMTCPCKGNLCNGPNKERETEAFNILPKLVAKTKAVRIKRNTPNNNISSQALDNNGAVEKIDHVAHINELITELNPTVKAKTTEGKGHEMKQIDTHSNSVKYEHDVNKADNAKLPTLTTPNAIQQITVKSVKSPEKMEKQSVSSVKPTAQMPPPESLLQNTSPNSNVEIVTEDTGTVPVTAYVTSTTIKSSTDMDMSSEIPVTIKPKKGHGMKYTGNTIVLIVNFSLLYTISS